MDFKKPCFYTCTGSFMHCGQAQDQQRFAGYFNGNKAGNAAEMAKYMNSTVELLLLEKKISIKECS